jgi:hypothetical protein
VDLENRIIAVSRAVEETKGYRGIKAPKTERGLRAFKIDEALAGLLAAHREKQERLVAGLPDRAKVDLSLIKLPAGALLFPGGEGTDLTKLRDGRAVSRTFKKRAIALGLPATLRLHDLRGSCDGVARRWSIAACRSRANRTRSCCASAELRQTDQEGRCCGSGRNRISVGQSIGTEITLGPIWVLALSCFDFVLVGAIKVRYRIYCQIPWQEWRDSNPQPPVLETGALAD